MVVTDVEESKGRCFSKAQPHHPHRLASKGHNASLDRAPVACYQMDQYQESELRKWFSGWIACCCQHLAAVERELIGGDVVCWRPAMEACIGDLGDLESVGIIRGSIQCFRSLVRRIPSPLLSRPMGAIHRREQQSTRTG